MHTQYPDCTEFGNGQQTVWARTHSLHHDRTKACLLTVWTFGNRAAGLDPFTVQSCDYTAICVLNWWPFIRSLYRRSTVCSCYLNGWDLSVSRCLQLTLIIMYDVRYASLYRVLLVWLQLGLKHTGCCLLACRNKTIDIARDKTRSALYISLSWAGLIIHIRCHESIEVERIQGDCTQYRHCQWACLQFNWIQSLRQSSRWECNICISKMDNTPAMLTII